MSPKLILVIFCLSVLAMVLGSSGATVRGAGGCEGCGEAEERYDSYQIDRPELAYSAEGTRGRGGLLNMLLNRGIVGARARRNPLPRVSMDISTMLLGELLSDGAGSSATTDHNFELFRQAGKK
ncbi:PREDICTED: uncharacterized protein LOC109472995 [Branchiostoma belcheri]|uniref:Uncharacterized protein LOC109472995 n=1 Tax=Branchiostoma belcheri TaxID=7741 RepID=A0A6P4Z394_BRABE|nr:PREDICTED: uncharacterized protein LOC109472995 [Branchiostoma belcheri]